MSSSSDSASVSSGASIALMCVNIQNLAGTFLAIDIPVNATVDYLQQLIHELPVKIVECSLEQQRLFVMPSAVATDMASSQINQSEAMTLDDDTRTLASYGIVNEMTVYIVVRAYELGEFVRTFSSCCSGTGPFNGPWGMCMSSNGELLFVADGVNHKVQLFRATDGSHVRTIGSKGSGDGQFKMPYFICLSHNDSLLFVTDSGNNRVQVLSASDGSHVRTIGSKGSDIGQFNDPCGLCLSPDNEYLFVSDTNNHRVQVVRLSDGQFIRTIGSKGSGTGRRVN